MFSGIVEVCSPVLSAGYRSDVLELQVQKPSLFHDVKAGDSVCVNGVCLTIEKLINESMIFAISPETLRVTHWTRDLLLAKLVNLERSLRYGERVHGHFVTGHVDGVARVASLDMGAETLMMTIEVNDLQRPFLWKKGSVSLNGVSLTINEVRGHLLSVWLIPETLKRTNLGSVNVGELVCVEVDYVARGLFQVAKRQDRPYVEDRL